MSAYWPVIQACNPPIQTPLIPWYIEGQKVGWLKPEMADLMAQQSIFQSDAKGLVLDPDLNSFQSRNQALAELCQKMEQNGTFRPRLGETYPISTGYPKHALALIDRAHTVYFGTISFGQHLNGLVQKNGQIYMWIARRAADRKTFPNHLDNMVAGGLPWPVKFKQNLIKEAQEEAGIPIDLIQQSRPCSVITYRYLNELGLRRDVIYCYDLILPDDFVPHNQDGEVADFQLLSWQEVAQSVQSMDQFKPNCHLVIIDFLIRWGYIQSEDPDYLHLNLGLRPSLDLD